MREGGRWPTVFLLAALFNYAIGLPIVLAARWSYDLSFTPEALRDPMALRLWFGFGFAVVLIGVGYHIFSRDLAKNRVMLPLGIVAKLYDVFNLSYLYLAGFARPLVLLPALIDATFVALFVAFWLSAARRERAARAVAAA